MNVNGTVRASARQTSLAWALPALLLAGLVVRLFFIPSEGFKTDVSTYAAWALGLSQHGFASFYSTIGFVDYPPGYFYVLAAIGHLWQLLFAAHDRSFAALRVLVKLPAVIADLGVGALLYATVRRFAGVTLGLAAAALYLLNPAVTFVSALWGQVDSISGGFALLAVYALLRSDCHPERSAEGAQSKGRPTLWIVFGWIAFAYSLLIKPQAAVLLPLLIAFAFVDPQRRRTRLPATAIGVAAGLLLALLLTEPFHPSNPIEALSWLWQRYASGLNVYPYNSVNAFNLWAIHGALWVPDNQYILLLPQKVWGVLLVGAALALIVWRYLQERTSQALLEGCAIATLAFFVLATRMHERYLFNGLLFTIACVPFTGLTLFGISRPSARRYLWGTVALSGVLLANLMYSLQYLNVVTNNVSGANATNLWGIWMPLISAVAVATFFVLGYQYLGEAEAGAATAAAPRETAPPVSIAAASPERHWYDPREGLTAMRAPLDYVIMGALGVGNFILSFVGYWWPPGTSCWALPGISRCGIFDEIYFARAAEEYLQNMRIYENTHPPLSKLLIAFSLMLFGGMPKGHGLGGWTGLNAIIGHMSNGDNVYGWRFLDVVFGALVVMLLYAFAKRITGSTLFAAIAALLLTFDGMHFVQSRIATPEGFVVCFATLAVYAFYRFWISSQVGERAHVAVPAAGLVAGAACALLAGFAVGQASRLALGFDGAATTIVTLYVACAAYLVVRYVAFPRLFGDGRRELTYAEGSRALRGNDGTAVFAADGGTIDSRGRITRGVTSQAKGGALVYRDDPLVIEYRRDASVRYQTPDGDAVYADDEIRAGSAVEKGRSSKLWLVFFTVALGLLVSTKWYGVMGFGVSFVVLIFVWLQRSGPERPTVWGNPRGFRLDGALATILLVSATVYALVWVPDLLRHSPDPGEIHNLNDVVYRQYSMYEYHDTLKATHPYSSKWWEWPLDYVPIAYFYEDHRKDQNNPNGCCIYEVTSIPNPVILWFGLLCVPWVAVLAWHERNKGYALIVLTYLLQWLPWIRSPRITFAYHFYVDIPLICLCNVIVLQRLWFWAKNREGMRWLGGLGVGAYVAAAAAGFVFFYPILSAHGISWNAWHAKMWFPTWIIGPG
ncbi:MAG TPA: phospholipid carrier-dependent glycosyltransferase [Candidatus Babeliales bacterium]|nr:phospholipid carrier-dependent glycosyltransferase [Candidatus Babeliales bacterium]